jgi:hypothetical protein
MKRAVIAIAVVLGITLAVVAWFWLVPITWSLPTRMKAPLRGELVRAIRTVDVSDSEIRFQPGRFRVAIGDHTIDVHASSRFTVRVDHLKLGVVPPDAPSVRKRVGATDRPALELELELKEARIRTDGDVRVGLDALPAVPLGEMTITADAKRPPHASAELLFARLIMTLIADSLHAGLSASPPGPREAELRTSSARIGSAEIALQPGAELELPGGNRLVVGESSAIKVRNLEYRAAMPETWTARAEIDVGCIPTTRFVARNVVCQPGKSRLKLALMLALDGGRLQATSVNAPRDNPHLVIENGSVESTAPDWQAALSKTDIQIDRLVYSATRRGNDAELALEATLKSSATLHWNSRGWQASAGVATDGLKLTVPLQPVGRTSGPPTLTASSERPATLANLALERDVGSGILRVNLGSVSAAGRLANAVALKAYVDQFHAAGGRVDYVGNDGLKVSADFTAGGSFRFDDPNPAGSAASGSRSPRFALNGNANRVALTSPRNEKLTLTDVELEVSSLAGDSPGISVACKGNAEFRSDRLAIAGARAEVDSLKLRPGPGNKLKGTVVISLSVPKSELCNIVRAELAKPIKVPGGNLGRVLELDTSVSELAVNGTRLAVNFVGAKLHVEGPISASGTLTTGRRIVIPRIVNRKIVSHNHFALEARIAANGTPAFPAAETLAQQAIEIDVDYRQAQLQLGGFLGGLPFAGDVFRGALRLFGIEDKIKKALPGKVSLRLFPHDANNPGSDLARMRRPIIQIIDGPDRLKVTASAELDF